VLLRDTALLLDVLRVAVLVEARDAVLVEVRDDANALDLFGVPYLEEVSAEPLLRRVTGPATVVRYDG